MTEKSGNVNITRITEKAIIDAREKRAYGKGHAANNFLKAVKPMFAYAKSRGWLNQDPAKDVTYVRPLKGSRPAWTFEDVVAYEHRHPVGTMANLAMRILLFTGLRRSDAIELGPMHLEDGIITFMPSKTKSSSGVKVSFRALPPLLEVLEHTEIGTETFIITERKTPFASGASFGTWFKNRCDEAGVEFRAHGLRKTGPALAAEAGASANELMAMWGWSTLAQAELYTKSANRKILGDSAATKLMNGYSEMLKNSGNTPRT